MIILIFNILISVNQQPYSATLKSCNWSLKVSNISGTHSVNLGNKNINNIEQNGYISLYPSLFTKKCLNHSPMLIGAFRILFTPAPRPSLAGQDRKDMKGRKDGKGGKNGKDW